MLHYLMEKAEEEVNMVYDPMKIKDPIEALAYIEHNAKTLEEAKKIAESTLSIING